MNKNMYAMIMQDLVNIMLSERKLSWLYVALSGLCLSTLGLGFVRDKHSGLYFPEIF